VLAGGTKGYRHHPQLARFQSQPDPSAAIATFLASLADEAQSRGYHFDATKVSPVRVTAKIPETNGPIALRVDPLESQTAHARTGTGAKARSLKQPEPHPLFRIVAGKVREWEKV